MKVHGKTVVAPVLSGAAAGLTLIARDFFPLGHLLVFLCFLPLWIVWLQETSAGRAAWQGWLAQIALACVAFPWIAHTVSEFGGLSRPAAWLAFAFFAAGANLFIPVTGFLWLKIFPPGSLPRGGRLIALVLTQAAAERTVPMLFDWHLGYAWYFLGWPAYQVADVIGFSGLGTLTLMIGGLLAYAALPDVRRKFRIRAVVGAALTVGALNLGGLARKAALEPPDARVRALVVQGNIGNRAKLRSGDPLYRNEIVDRYLRLTEMGLAKAARAGQQIDFAVWPENAFPDVISELGSVENHFRALQDFLVRHRLTLLTGAYGFDDQARTTNAFFVLPPKRTWRVPTYHKTHLLAFGEYLPGARWFPFLHGLLPAVGHFSPGPGPAVLPLDLPENRPLAPHLAAVKLGPQICYEGLFDRFSRESARLGAEILVNVTNDSWYGSGQEPWQHLYLTAARAVENRRPLLRATNTGISAAVLADGTLLPLSPLDREWTGVFEIPYRRRPSPVPFQSYGYWLMPGGLTLGLLLCIGRRRRGGPPATA